MNRIVKILIAYSRLLNTILGGSYNEMLSARVYREKIWWAIFIIDALFFWQKDHCKIQYEWELNQAE